MNKFSLGSPIGVFDSGVGGLSIAKAIMQSLPSQDIIYFADTAHLPYGKRTFSEIQQYTKKIIEFLVAQDCKIIVIACNTATAASSDIIEEFSRNNIKIFNVVDPVIKYVTENYQNCKLGLLCTTLTYQLGVFENRIELHGNNLRLISLKASDLAHLIELEFDNKNKLKKLIKEYLFHHQFLNTRAMILGCTHYLWLKEDFIELNPFIDWIEPSVLLARELEQYLVGKVESFPFRSGFSRIIFFQTGNNSNLRTLAKQHTPDNYQATFIQCFWSDGLNTIQMVSEAASINESFGQMKEFNHGSVLEEIPEKRAVCYIQNTQGRK